MQWLRLPTLDTADGVRFLVEPAFFHSLKGLSLCFVLNIKCVVSFPLTSKLLLGYNYWKTLTLSYIHAYVKG